MEYLSEPVKWVPSSQGRAAVEHEKRDFGTNPNNAIQNLQLAAVLAVMHFGL
jgi:hypothetical protein